MTLIALRPESLPAAHLALHDTANSRLVEAWALAQNPAFTLMERAGMAVFKLSAALYPHAQQVWVACGPGNNGGDGLVAAAYWHERLQRCGGRVTVSWLGEPDRCSPDTLEALALAQAAGVTIQTQAPTQFDLAIDALWGLGLHRPPEGLGAAWVHTLQTCRQPVVCVDLPSGLHADTGAWLASGPAQAAGPRHTLTLLTIKPGLWTGQGRACCGEIWFDDLGVSTEVAGFVPTAWLQGPLPANTSRAQQHLGHKGTHGDVLVLGGQWPHGQEPGMVGAAWLAARAALRAGAGRVYVRTLEPSGQALGGQGTTTFVPDPLYPEIMHRPALPAGQDPLAAQATVVCGCGGGQRVAAWLPSLISRAPTLVLDADALNALAADRPMMNTLNKRHHRGLSTILTPHPLEAARLLKTTVAEVQHNRLQAAQALADQTASVVVLKGSGTIVAAAGVAPIVNTTGNDLLGTAGSGDVLAGMLGAALAPHKGLEVKAVQQMCANTVFEHGLKANLWQLFRPMVASDLL
jgi:ADP-dependent NAD(P)H-hydrate dehydratase / NAD(P)H-hydrate epimerase